MKHFGVTDPRLEDYMQSLLSPAEGVLADMEAHAEREGLGVIGRLQGQFLHALVLALKPKDILEVGTAIGYSAMWLSTAAHKVGARVVTLERDPSRAVWAEAYMRQAGLSGVCAVRRGDALVLMRGMEESFDLVFLDVLTQFERADTSLEMLDLCVRRLRPGGVLLSDNALRSGQVLAPQDHSPSTQGIAAFNQAIFTHPRLTSTIIPIRDGLSMSVKS